MAEQARLSRKLVLAETISFFANPAIILVVSIAIIGVRFTSSVEQFLRWTSIGALLLVGPSLLYSALAWRKEGKIDIDMTRREDRVVPLVLSSLGAVVGAYIIQTRLHHGPLLLLSNVLIAMILALTVVTMVWKISLHAATLTATVTLIVLFRSPAFVWLYLLVFPLAWARLTLKQHTPAQLIAGSVIGVLTTYLASIVFRS